MKQKYLFIIIGIIVCFVLLNLFFPDLFNLFSINQNDIFDQDFEQQFLHFYNVPLTGECLPQPLKIAHSQEAIINTPKSTFKFIFTEIQRTQRPSSSFCSSLLYKIDVFKDGIKIDSVEVDSVQLEINRLDFCGAIKQRNYRAYSDSGEVYRASGSDFLDDSIVKLPKGESGVEVVFGDGQAKSGRVTSCYQFTIINRYKIIYPEDYIKTESEYETITYNNKTTIRNISINIYNNYEPVSGTLYVVRKVPTFIGYARNITKIDMRLGIGKTTKIVPLSSEYPEEGETIVIETYFETVRDSFNTKGVNVLVRDIEEKGIGTGFFPYPVTGYERPVSSSYLAGNFGRNEREILIIGEEPIVEENGDSEEENLEKEITPKVIFSLIFIIVLVIIIYLILSLRNRR